MRSRPAVLLIPVLGRPHRVAPLLESIYATTGGEDRTLFIASPGDEGELRALGHAGADWIEVEGNYATKINAGVTASEEPLIFTGADDLAFHDGWLEAALEVMDRTLAGVVGTQDLCNPAVIRGEHATHFLIARDYVDYYGTIDEPGKVFHEGYPHEYVDDELIATARSRAAYAFAPESVVEHLHPLAGKAAMDELYAQAPDRMKRGRRIFNARRHLWA